MLRNAIEQYTGLSLVGCVQSLVCHFLPSRGQKMTHIQDNVPCCRRRKHFEQKSYVEMFRFTQPDKEHHGCGEVNHSIALSASTRSATACPESSTSGIPPPGCVPPPTKYSC